MPLEVELKFPVESFEDLRLGLARLGAESRGRHFESNAVFDDAARTLRAGCVLLRLRHAADTWVLTVKRPPDEDPCGACKVFEELETRVEDGRAMRAALEALGFREVFAYEKIRETWEADDLAVCLDLLPFGRFVELEGPEERILAVAGALGLDMAVATKATYHALNAEYRREAGLAEDESFVFGGRERERLLQDLG